MGRPPKNAPMTYSELLNEGSEAKQSKLYRAQTMELTDEAIAAIVSGTAADMEATAQRKKLSLENTEAVKEQTMVYLHSCAASSTIPNFSALCRALGFTAEGVNKFKRKHPEHSTSVWLVQTHDAMAEALANAALKGAVNPVVSIFTLKARSGWRDSVVIETAPAANPLDTMTVDEIVSKYADLPED